MFYVNEEMKKLFDLDRVKPLSPAELNYVVTTICRGYLESPSYKGGRWDYRRVNDIIGVLECAKIEFYRKTVPLLTGEEG